MPTLVLRAGAVALATATTLVGVTLTAAPASAHTASANQQVKLAPRTHFTMKPDGSSGKTEGGEGIPNIDSVKSTVRTYYNATDGIADKTDSPYIDELQQITHSPWHYLRKVAKAEKSKAARGHRHKKPAIVFDADDTTLWTYDMEDAGMKFNFDPVLQDVYVQDQRFPATPGMVKFVNTAQKLGFAVFGLTAGTTRRRWPRWPT